MKYRVNSKNGDQLSILGFGCMRLPKKGSGIDESRSIQMIHTAIEQGVNYFDTAYVYNNGKSESVLGEALLTNGYRNRVKIATKMPPFMVKKASDFDKIFDKELQRLQTNYIDYYLIHMLADVATWERLKALGILLWIAEKKEHGQIRNIGFSYHGGRQGFVELIDAYDWDFCQIQYNYLDEYNQATKNGLHYATSKNIPVIIMEPLRGGKIINGLPKEVNEIWRAAKPARSAANWALRWVWNHPEALVVLSGMSTEEQLEENIIIGSEAEANALSDESLDLFRQAKEILARKIKVNCTACGYCLPCPNGVDIPTCFSAYNEKYMNPSRMANLQYMLLTGASTAKPGYASLCIHCKKCEKHCPQSIPISDKMTEVSKDMEKFWFKPAIMVAKKFMG